MIPLQTSSYFQLPEIFYTLATPTASIQPEWFFQNKCLFHSLTHACNENELLAQLAGQKLTVPSLAQAYMGHQFGHLNQLGDGRAILLGETKIDNQRIEIQLKGSGRTNYSRSGDGLASIGPMMRELIISEAMHELKIATTRIAAVITTGKPVRRYQLEKGALAVRTATSYLRVGTFQYAQHFTTFDDRKALVDYAIQTLYPHLQNDENPALALLQAVCKKQAQLIAQWMHVGFVHGVMNTDNMTISGETIDYGPCAFLDAYQADTVFSSIDQQGRYRYIAQPGIAGWNLARFAESLVPLIHEEAQEAIQLATQAVQQYAKLFEHYWLAGMRKKVGLLEELPGDEQFIQQLLDQMEKDQLDFTETFRSLTLQTCEEEWSPAMKKWYQIWYERIAPQAEQVRLHMQQVNPAVIARNYLVEEAIQECEKSGSTKKAEQLLELIKNPFSYTEQQLHYTLPAKERNRIFTTYCGT